MNPEPRIRRKHAGLLRIGGIAALLVVTLTLAEIVFFVLVPPPETVKGWFGLLMSAPVTGVLGFWGLEIPLPAAGHPEPDRPG